ncbi:efflux RND transporter periplasmic adaptor subunit [Parasulfuritortus cantonensis]|uniref:Efflux RND transporter periplasmic adaptor subunit n=1 Tax=Parasulfuritortus cantonensis TaxID=2528202 RepID=A0A4R1BF98_9PROT|nr:efflux RND transporter periplasmic adaptor subunit [Parasulfuritortus cantonensis]TCJ15820.1 efflux RND transporter periplasmic adaptor subunit [Parasulfuritortus cantonensis]
MPRNLPFFILFMLATQAWGNDNLVALSASQRAALRIATAPLVADAGAVSVGLPARVTVPPTQERLVMAPLAGIVSEVRVAAGDLVKAGQTLAVLRGEGLIGAQRDIAQAAVQYRLAEESARRDEALFKEGIIPESRLQNARAGLAQARAVFNERRAWLRLIGLGGNAIVAAERGERMTDSIGLASPIAGVVLEQQAMVGARVDTAGMLFKVARLDPLWLEIQAPAEMAARIKPGQKVGVPGTQAVGSILSVGRGVSEAQTVPVRARVSNRDGLLRLNQSVSARIEGVAGDKQWRVPVSAVVRQDGQNWVFVERAGGFEPKPVKVLAKTAQSVAIDAAFVGDEKIAIEGVATLKAAWQGE